MKERNLQRSIIEHLQKRRIWYLKTPPECRNGTPDIILCHRGMFIALELKNEHGHMTKLQKFERMNILESGGEVHVVRSLDEVKAILN